MKFSWILGVWNENDVCINVLLWNDWISNAKYLSRLLPYCATRSKFVATKIIYGHPINIFLILCTEMKWSGVQVWWGTTGETWDSSASTVPCLLGATAKAEMHQGVGWSIDDWECRGCASTCKAVRRPWSLPQVHETVICEFQDSRGNRGLEISAEQWPVAWTRDYAVHWWSWIGISHTQYQISLFDNYMHSTVMVVWLE